MDDRKHGTSTTLVEGGRRKEWRGRLVNVPSSAPRPSCSTMSRSSTAPRPASARYRYGLQGTATHWALAEALTELEPGAAGTALYPSGLAAITGPLLALLVAGRRAAGAGQCLWTDPQVLRHHPQALRCRDALLRSAGRQPDRGADRTDNARDPARKPRLADDGSAGRARHLRASRASAASSPCSTIPGRRPCCSRRSPPGSISAILAGTKYVGGHADVMLGAATATAEVFEQTSAFGLGPRLCSLA